MRWIHLSYPHIDSPSDGRSTEQLRELLTHIQREHIIADYLFITGDYRNAKYPREDIESIVKAAADVILAIASAAKIEITNIYLMPRNHDVRKFNGKILIFARGCPYKSIQIPYIYRYIGSFLFKTVF